MSDWKNNDRKKYKIAIWFEFKKARSLESSMDKWMIWIDKKLNKFK
jgi:hypothetical protein